MQTVGQKLGFFCAVSFHYISKPFSGGYENWYAMLSVNGHWSQPGNTGIVVTDALELFSET